jgi:UDP-N-acetylmuramyl pentapeptide phosphotransferase/UDP-N-acetylglucosamine-1-phosphate transferase/glycosyltransferase involved in cell wall biosynthesis
VPDSLVAIFVFCVALAGAAVLTPLVMLASRSLGLLAIGKPPGDADATPRDANATPRLGGLAIALAAAGVSIAALLRWSDRPGGSLPTELLVMFGAAGLFALVAGVVNDVVKLSGKLKAIVLLIASLAVCSVGIQIAAVTVNSNQTELIRFGLFAWGVTALWIVGVSSAINFIDGLDGLAAGICAVAAILLGLVNLGGGQMALALMSFSLGGALLGFLLFNFHPARILFGDSGSMFVGFSLATLSVLTAQQLGTTFGLMLPAIALAVPLVDFVLTLFRRSIVDRRSLFAGERGHVHHRLIDMGVRHPHVVLLLWGATIACALLGAVATYGKAWATLAGLSMLVPLLVGLFRMSGSVRLRETLRAVRRNRNVEREAAHYRNALESLQLGFRHCQNFDQWWQRLCGLAEALDFSSMTLPLQHRDGNARILSWVNEAANGSADEDTLHAPLEATVPVPQRRHGQTLAVRVTVACGSNAESAGHRLALFTRLLAEQGLDRLGSVGMKSAIDMPATRPAQSKSRSAVKKLTARQRRAAQFDVTSSSVLNTAGDRPPRVAIVHDFLYTYAGAERVLEQLVKVYPDADLFSLFDFLPEGKRGFIHDKPVTTTFIQGLPFASSNHRLYLPLMPLAVEQLDVSAYDIVISSSYLAAKGVITKPNQLHICYCHTPARYAWDLQNQYLGANGMISGLKSMLARSILHYIRNWDTRCSNGVDVYVTNSNFIGLRVEKTYRRRSTTIYPPVDVESFKPTNEPREGFYLCVTRLVPYKRVDLVVEAFNAMPDKRLIVIGAGPDMEKLKQVAGPNVKLMGFQPDEQVRRYMAMCKAFVYAAEEDFGIVLVEAQASGAPVIAFGQGGAREIVLHEQTGVLYDLQSAASIKAAVEHFERLPIPTSEACRANAERFSAGRFRDEIAGFVTDQHRRFLARLNGASAVESDRGPIVEVEVPAAPTDASAAGELRRSV